MDVSCPACAARYTADDEKLRGKTARMRCRTCDTVWLVSGPQPEAEAAALHAPVASESTSKRAAVVRRGSEREKRDLFATREPEYGSVKQTLLPPPSFGLTGGVGARNENSVLFRVDQLVGAGRVKTPEPAPAPAIAGQSASPGSDDDGIIDLKALASAPPRRIGVPVAPLFSEPPAMSLDVDDSGPRSAAGPGARFGKMQLVGAIAAAAAFLLLVGFGISVAFKGEEPVKHTAAVVAPPAAVEAPPPKAEPAPAPATVAAADDASDTSEAAEKTEKKAAKGPKGKRGKAAKGKAKGVITSKSPAPAPKTVKAADPCHCKGDFNCILACTARGGK
ncbi:MAG: zinc-ribbon domain-containing protein [Labilithrix sp.]|nr:zinc-ribbon domain-containing protein [Labilithrix sp.]MCW5836575.1 zinc-ribbon domain-containing protein [Labilithrix sp.]